jgi:hypothetical protein
MKKHIELSILAILVLFVSCQKFRNLNSPIEGKWAITSYFINDTDRATQFAPYTFSFGNKGQLSVSNTGMMNMCSFSMHDNIYHINMMGMHSEPLSQLDADWMLTNVTDSSCSFLIYASNRDCHFRMHRR